MIKWALLLQHIVNLKLPKVSIYYEHYSLTHEDFIFKLPSIKNARKTAKYFNNKKIFAVKGLNKIVIYKCNKDIMLFLNKKENILNFKTLLGEDKSYDEIKFRTNNLFKKFILK